MFSNDVVLSTIIDSLKVSLWFFYTHTHTRVTVAVWRRHVSLCIMYVMYKRVVNVYKPLNFNRSTQSQPRDGYDIEMI